VAGGQQGGPAGEDHRLIRSCLIGLLLELFGLLLLLLIAVAATWCAVAGCLE
jgi:hypothetical protein